MPLPRPFLTAFHGPGPGKHGAWLFAAFFGGGGSPCGPGGGGGGARSALKEREAGAKGPRPALFCLAGPGGGRPPGPPNAAAPPGSLGSCRPFDLSVISRPISCLQTKRAASKKRRASASCRKSKEAFQLVFPRFFQKRAGVWGQRPQRGPGAEPLAGRGAAPRATPPVTSYDTDPCTGGRSFPR